MSFLFFFLVILNVFGDVKSFSAFSSSDNSKHAAVQKLHAQQQAAKTRRAEVERVLLQPERELVEYTTSKNSNKNRYIVAREWAKVLKDQGVLRINNAFTAETSKKLRRDAIIGIERAKIQIRDGTEPRHLLGMELERKCRNELLLTFERPKKLRIENQDEDENEDDDNSLEDILQELLGKKSGKLRELFEVLLTKKAVLFDLAVIITERGSDRQCIHADMPFHDNPPLFSIFGALQDVTFQMGPTVFLKGSISKADQKEWSDVLNRDEFLRNCIPYHALLKAGDVVVYDPRILHCGAANDAETGNTRAIFNMGFRDPKFITEIGYTGSLRPAYVGRITLEEITNLLDFAPSTTSPTKRKHLLESLGNGLVI